MNDVTEMLDTVQLSSGEIISRYDYHRMSSDTGYCPCDYCARHEAIDRAMVALTTSDAARKGEK